MNVPYSWLKELVDINWQPQETADRLTIAGSEAEVETPYTGQFENMVVGKVTELENVPETDHLTKATVDIGGETLQVICGAPNVDKGQKIILAGIGAVVADGTKIKKVKLRGVESYGMICSERELGLSDDHSGIMVLDEDTPVGIPANDYLRLDDSVLKLDLTPNRPDMLSIFGAARDIACLAGKTVTLPEFKLNESGGNASDMIKVSIADSDACPRYAARIIKNITIGPSPWWIKQKLLLCGIRPISNIVDITNLVMLETGHPLHAFDYDKFDHKEILVRRAADGEKFATLDGNEHELTSDVLLITDGSKAVAAAGIMGGLDSEVSDSTTTVLLEAAYFDPRTTRRGRLHLGLVTESSSRFEKGADPNMVADAIDRAASLMEQYAGGEVLKGIVDCYPKRIDPISVKFRLERANAVLGTGIDKDTMLRIFDGLGFSYKENESIDVSIPTYRPDIEREIDLIEEIARIYGLDNIPVAEKNIGPLFSKAPDDDRFRDLIRRTFTAQGFDEIYGIGLADPKLLKAVTGDKPQLKVVNPLSEDLSVLQNGLNYSLLKAVSHNLAHRNISLRFFEIGKSFTPETDSSEFTEIGLAVTGRSNDLWYEKGKEYQFYHVKGAVDTLCQIGRIPELVYDLEPISPYIKECSFAIKLNGKLVGYAGQVDSKIARRFEIKQPVITAVIDFDTFYAAQIPDGVYIPLPRFPAAPRDLAVVVDDTVRVGDMLETIRKIGGNLLERLDIFDLYRGQQVGEGKKSLAFAMVYRLDERSLENEEVAEIHGNIADELKRRFNAEIREG